MATGRRLRIERLEDRRLLASLSGYVYDDSVRNDGLRQAGDPAIAGAVVSLAGSDDLGQWVSLSATTDAQGAYGFANLRAGFYKLKEDQPPGYLDGKDALGTAGGTAGDDQFSHISIAAATNGTGYNFGELRPGSLSGHVWDDTPNNDGIRGNDPDEPGIAVSNLLLTGTDDLGQKVRLTAVTDSKGAYSFANLRPGTYSISDDVPVGYSNGKTALGTLGGTVGPDNFDNITLPTGTSGADYDFGKLMRYDINPAVAYTVVLKKPNGNPVSVDAAGKYHLCQGDSFTIEVYATDVRRGVGASGGVASAHAKLLFSPDFMDFVTDSLEVAPAFDLAASGTINWSLRRIEDAGGSFDLAVNGQQTPGARTPQLLFSVGGHVPDTVPSTSVATFRLLPADDISLKTMVYGMDAPVSGDFQVLTLRIGSAWRNSFNPWDVNADGVVNDLDELAVVDALAAGGPRQLPETAPPRGPFVDVSGDGVLNYLDALLIRQHLHPPAPQAMGAVAVLATPATDATTSSAAVADTPQAVGNPISFEAVDLTALATALLTLEQQRPQVPEDQVLGDPLCGLVQCDT
jgi:hypothetical protein